MKTTWLQKTLKPFIDKGWNVAPNLIDVMAENRTWQLLVFKKHLNRLFIRV